MRPLRTPASALIARPFTARPVTLTIGGRPATILYSDAVPYQTIGMLQVNAIVPEGTGPGPQPVVLTIGQSGNAQEQVTIAIR